jgi:hypothetical protein
MDFIAEKILPAVLVVLIVVMLFFIGMLPFGLYAERVCLQNGYPHSYITWKFEMSCGRTVNQTEYVCPLDDVIANSCSLR